ncbi:methylated-DNA--[protein]-cysteine S-methyltransferase [Hoyosella rhizosphaerae]|uniref:Methylated-DNA--protein-cysteine methyltransferase n=1 Tax=Hoyosella rhizosphaerae TaxID=1755582 RepID=A0A916U8K8_9ACTN|nr:methylated-DNA--[protein]-cysteine S-methyltransferase [Hoyosella rhizosphaerae]GGC63185.1 methylated-DNA--protein-cysteine methyltransferase [Hoyosella rhizosphaerae]
MTSPLEDALRNALLNADIPTSNSALHQQLSSRAYEAHLVDVAYNIIETPIGRLLLARTSRGLVRVAFDNENLDSVLESLAAQLSPRVMQVPRKLDDIADQFSEYFAGNRTKFSVTLDFSLSTGFRQQVQQQLPTIAYGHTQSYKEVAASVGNPKAIRAVGTACATNPLPIVVPCHRVVRSDGSLGGYLGGLDTKRTLLELEHTKATAQ